MPDDRWVPEPGARWQFYVDVVGTCNLRCPSCPVGNSEPAMPTGVMSPDLLDRIVQKAKSECDRVDFGLFNWTEPFIHPRLGEMIRTVRKHGVSCSLSSNLNIIKRLDEVMEANPDHLKVSLSGYTQERYGVTHERGDIELVKRNMATLAETRDRLGATTRLHVAFHRYLGNHEDERQMRQFAESLGYEFEPFWAVLMPLEKLLAYADPDATDVRLTDKDRELIHRLALPLDRAIEAARGVGARRCSLRDRQMTLNHEGRVSLCCAAFDPVQYDLAAYLDAPIGELQQMKMDHSQCGSCMRNGLHVYMTGGFDMDALALERVAAHYPDAEIQIEGVRRRRPHGVRGWARKARKRYERLLDGERGT